MTAKQLTRIVRVILYFDYDRLDCLAQEIHMISSPCKLTPITETSPPFSTSPQPPYTKTPIIYDCVPHPQKDPA
jgi:hypothetical protein